MVSSPPASGLLFIATCLTRVRVGQQGAKIPFFAIRARGGSHLVRSLVSKYQSFQVPTRTLSKHKSNTARGRPSEDSISLHASQSTTPLQENGSPRTVKLEDCSGCSTIPRRYSLTRGEEYFILLASSCFRRSAESETIVGSITQASFPLRIIRSGFRASLRVGPVRIMGSLMTLSPGGYPFFLSMPSRERSRQHHDGRSAFHESFRKPAIGGKDCGADLCKGDTVRSATPLLFLGRPSVEFLE